jgi:hypothetical protein
MTSEIILFSIIAAGLMIVEIMLIVSVRQLTNSIKKLNGEVTDKFNVLVDEINKKFKGIIDLAVAYSKVPREKSDTKGHDPYHNKKGERIGTWA